MADEKSVNDVSGMSATERVEHIQKEHAKRQDKAVTPHDLRVAAREQHG
jgi:hypothetical protein